MVPNCYNLGSNRMFVCYMKHKWKSRIVFLNTPLGKKNYKLLQCCTFLLEIHVYLTLLPYLEFISESLPFRYQHCKTNYSRMQQVSKVENLSTHLTFKMHSNQFS